MDSVEDCELLFGEGDFGIHFRVNKHEQVMETIIYLGYILSHYKIKRGANVCIVLGK